MYKNKTLLWEIPSWEACYLDILGRRTNQGTVRRKICLLIRVKKARMAGKVIHYFSSGASIVQGLHQRCWRRRVLIAGGRGVWVTGMTRVGARSCSEFDFWATRGLRWVYPAVSLRPQSQAVVAHNQRRTPTQFPDWYFLVLLNKLLTWPPGATSRLLLLPPTTPRALDWGPWCSMSILRNANVACLYRLISLLSTVEFEKCLCSMSLYLLAQCR